MKVSEDRQRGIAPLPPRRVADARKRKATRRNVKQWLKCGEYDAAARQSVTYA